MKLALQELALEAGVELLLHSWVSAPLMDSNTIRGLKVTNKSGEQVYKASIVVDTTGDGDIAASAGAPFEINGNDGLPQAMTMMLDVGSIVRCLPRQRSS